MKYILLLITSILFTFNLSAQSAQMINEFLYGVAYYHEYMPEERLDKDISLMKECGINTVRMGESTWTLFEPEDGRFEFEWFIRILDAMHNAGIKVIIGTPTYAIPQWMVKKYPDILVTTFYNKQQYGGRQNMDICHPEYHRYAERIVREMVSRTYNHPAVIGFQIDNETKSYSTASSYANALFLQHLKNKFGTVENLNKAWNFNYWSHTLTHWEDLNITGSYSNQAYWLEWNRFQHTLVTDFLMMQKNIVDAYKKPYQFVTQNFDLYWRNNQSSGPNPDVNHHQSQVATDIAGIDIYHEWGNKFDGSVISFAGDMTRSLKKKNYLVIETQAQAKGANNIGQYPLYDGQLRQAVYSHISSGANMVSYWPWHSLHNGLESFWKGILSHDMEPNRPFQEVRKTAGELKRIQEKIINISIKNEVAILYSIDAFNGIQNKSFSTKVNYADLINIMHKSAYKLNVGTDIIIPGRDSLENYKVVMIPALYIASDSLLQAIDNYVKNGGHVIMTFKSGFCDLNSRVYATIAPGLLRNACGFYYQEFYNPEKAIPLRGNPFKLSEQENLMDEFIELIIPETAKVLAHYDHPFFGKYAAITQNSYGNGSVTYIGSYPSEAVLKSVAKDVFVQAGIEIPSMPPSITLKKGKNTYQKTVYYYFNYSSDIASVIYNFKDGMELISGKEIKKKQVMAINPWDVIIIEEN